MKNKICQFSKTGLLLSFTAITALCMALPVRVEGDPETVSNTSASSCIECCEGDPLCEALTGLTDLRAAVNDLVPERGLANSLEAKVDAATISVLGGQYAAAINQLGAFANQVDAAKQSGRVSATTSNVMKTGCDTANSAISSLKAS